MNTTLEDIRALAHAATSPVVRSPRLLAAASREAGVNDLYYRFLYKSLCYGFDGRELHSRRHHFRLN